MYVVVVSDQETVAEQSWTRVDVTVSTCVCFMHQASVRFTSYCNTEYMSFIYTDAPSQLIHRLGQRIPCTRLVPAD